VPILATDLGALADRATGRVSLFGRGDAGALAHSLAQLARQPDVRATMRAAPAPATLDDVAHDEALGSVYRSVLAAPRPTRVPADPASLRRRAHAFDLREAGLGELLRSEGWESVVASLNAQLAGLRARLPDGSARGT
jgi:hypothetical protein